MRVNTNVSNKTRRELVLDDFKGVDFSSSPLKVSGSRASFASNLICDNGVNHKRPGWEQVLKLEGNINGMYEFGGALIVYAGKKFYKVENGNADTIEYTAIKYTAAEGFELIDQKVQFFPHKDRLYIIGCGDYLVYGSWDEGESYELRRVADYSASYVPTTTVYSEPECFWDNDPDGTPIAPPTLSKAGYTLEKSNAFSRRRKNTFIGGAWASDQNYIYYTDSPIDTEQEINITHEFCILNGSKYIIQSEKCKVDGEEISTYTKDGECVGIFVRKDLSYGLYSNGEERPYANVTIEFTAKLKGDDIGKMIRKCRFGTVFGAYGNSDRLFLSGNEDYPNYDFYSWYDDYSYFGSNAYTVMGTKEQAITGYVRLSDSTLATLKETSVTEPTVYYRTASEVEVELPNGDKTSDVVFTRWTGGIGEGCVSSYCIATLAGDDLMLSENGLFGIVQVQNSATNDRYFRERDRFINSDLVKRDLSEATAIVYNNRYYLAVDDVCYVADPRYKTYRSDDIDGSFNYEWWYWENIPARVFAIVNRELWFGTEEGMICRFDDKFTDRTYDKTVAGQLSADGSTLRHEENMDVEVCDGDEIELDGYDGRLYVTEYNASECTFKVSKEKDGDPISNIREELGIGTSVSPPTMKVWCYKNVVSKWFSPVFDLGAFDVSKTLLSMSITVDPTVRGKVQFGYDTRDCEKTILRNSLGEGFFDYDAINFSDFSFEANFAASHTVRVKDRNFNYITFKLISDNDKDCAVCNLKAVYQYNGRLKGVH